MAFYNVELDGICPAFGWQGGPEFNTLITQLKNGREVRNAQWDQVRHKYTLPFDSIHDQDYLTYLKSSFLSMRGQLHSFLIKDWADNAANNVQFGVGNGASKTFQLSIPSAFGLATYTRNITKPLSGVVVTVNGTATAVTIDTATGLVTFATAPASGTVLRWFGSFRIPVRFANDALAMAINSRTQTSFLHSGSIELIEVFGE